MKNISVFGYATFGNTNGFKQSCIFGNKNLEKVVKTFDLKTDAIQLITPNDRLYSIRKEFLKDSLLISYSVYTFAKERNSNRSGTFIGTSIVFTDEISPENQILSSLHHIHQNLKNNNVQKDNTLNISHSTEFNLDGVFSKDFEKLNNNTEQIKTQDWQNTESNLVIFSPKLDPNSIQFLFRKSLEILSNYYTIYLTDRKEIADFVAKQKLFKIINAEDLDREIQSIAEEKRQKLDLAVLAIQKEKENALTESKKATLEFEEKIQQNEKNQAENFQKIEKSKTELNALQKFYESYTGKLEELIANLQTNKNCAEAALFQKDLKNKFNSEKNKFQIPPSIAPFSPQKNAGNTTNSGNYERKNFRFDEPEKEKKIDYIKLVSVLSNLILIAALSYFMYQFFKKSDQDALAAANQFPLETAVIPQENLLNPIPADSLSISDKISLSKKFEKGKPLKEIVTIIFKENPENIGKVYQYQQKEYGNLLLEKNKTRFDRLLDSTYVLKDPVLTVPSFKIPTP